MNGGCCNTAAFPFLSTTVVLFELLGIEVLFTFGSCADLFLRSIDGCWMPGTGSLLWSSSSSSAPTTSLSAASSTSSVPKTSLSLSAARMGTANLFDLPEDVDAPPPPALADDAPPPPPRPPPPFVEVDVDEDEPAVAEAAEAHPPELHVTEVEEEAGLFC